jgi:hypothetical protein
MPRIPRAFALVALLAVAAAGAVEADIILHADPSPQLYCAQALVPGPRGRLLSVAVRKTENAANPGYLETAVFDSATGTVGIPRAVPLAGDTGELSVAWNPSSRSYLAAFTYLSANTRVEALVLDKEGLPLEGSGPVTIVTEPYTGTNPPKVTCDGSDWLLAWTANEAVPGVAGVHARRVRGASTNSAFVLGPQFTIASGRIGTRGVGAERGAGSDILVTWFAASPLGTPFESRLDGCIVNAADGLGPIRTYARTPFAVYPPSISRGAADFEMAWAESPALNILLSVKARRVAFDGTPLGDAVTVRDGNTDPVDHWMTPLPASVRICWNAAAAQHFACWLEGVPGTGKYKWVRGARVQGDVVVQTNIVLHDQDTTFAALLPPGLAPLPDDRILCQWADRAAYGHVHRLPPVTVLAAGEELPSESIVEEATGSEPCLGSAAARACPALLVLLMLTPLRRR